MRTSPPCLRRPHWLRLCATALLLRACCSGGSPLPRSPSALAWCFWAAGLVAIVLLLAELAESKESPATAFFEWLGVDRWQQTRRSHQRDLLLACLFSEGDAEAQELLARLPARARLRLLLSSAGVYRLLHTLVKEGLVTAATEPGRGLVYRAEVVA